MVLDSLKFDFRHNYLSLEDALSLGLEPFSHALSDLSLKDHNLESLEVSELGSSLLSGDLFGETGLSPFLGKVEGVDGVPESSSSHVSGDSRDQELGEGDSLDRDHLSLDTGGGSINKYLGVRIRKGELKRRGTIRRTLLVLSLVLLVSLGRCLQSYRL